MKGPNLVTADELVAWAESYESAEELPRLIRRLIRLTAGPLAEISFPAGKGINQGDYDGFVVAPYTTNRVPAKESVWEVSTEDKPSKKAERDYKRRTTQEPEEVRRSRFYIGVTLRRWSGRKAWVTKKKQANEWGDVRFYDADDLEEWLESEPAVHYWISDKLNKPVEAYSLDEWWRRWATLTSPEFAKDWLLSGREECRSELQKLVESSNEWFVLSGAPQQECIAFLYSTITAIGEAEAEELLARTLVVDSPIAWSILSSQSKKLLLVPTFDANDVQIGQAVQNNRVVLCDFPGQSKRSSATIPKIHIEELYRKLERDGIPLEESVSLARLARTSIQLLRQKIGAPRAFFNLAGATASDNSLITALLLVNQWNAENSSDQALVSGLAGRTYEEIESWLSSVSSTDVPMFRKSGPIWFLTDDGLSWNQFQPLIQEPVIKNYIKVAAALLSETDPSFQLDPQDRWKAGMLGRVPEHSHYLKKGISRTLAVLATANLTFSSRELGTGEEVARRLVRLLLSKAKPERWYSVGPWLSNLAEAAPIEFLAAIEGDLQSKSPASVKGLYSAKVKPMFGGDRHPELLWALERLAWSRVYLLRSSVVLARLVELDFGGKSGNNPQASLRGIFLPWSPCTEASTEERLRAVNHLRDSFPAVAWRLILSLTFESYAVGHPTSRPETQDWGQNYRSSVTQQDALEVYDQALRWAIQDAGVDPDRWAELATRAAVYKGDWFQVLCDGLNEAEKLMTNPADRAKLWESLRKTLAGHRRIPEADWAMSLEQAELFASVVEKYKPLDWLSRSRWLFQQWPELGQSDDQPEERERILSEMRREAVIEIHKSLDDRGPLELAAEVEAPGYIGRSIAQSNIWPSDREDTVLRAWLASDNAGGRLLVRGYIWERAVQLGGSWIFEKLNGEFGASLSDDQRAELLLLMRFEPATWQRVSAESEDVQRIYWSQVRPHFALQPTADEAEEFLSKLLEYDQEVTAIDWMGMHAHRNEKPAKPETMIKALEGLTKRKNMSDVPWNAIHHDIALILDLLDNEPSVELGRIVSLEYYFMPLLKHERTPKALGRAMALDPKVFIDLLSLAFRATGSPPQDLGSEEQARAMTAYDVLDRWRLIPGISEDGRSIDEKRLRSWVRTARKEARAVGRLRTADVCIGKLFGYSPLGEGDQWPHETVCKVMESVASKSLFSGFSTSVHNKRGVTTRSLDSGGAPERVLAKQYAGYAEFYRFRFLKVATVLDLIAESYVAQAGDEDRRANMYQDLP